MKIKASTLTSAVALLCAIAPSAMAQQVTIFDLADTNKDGFVDKAEDEAANLKSFKRYDTDGDGRLSQAEMAATFQGLPASEVARGVTANLSLMDTDKDGAISWDEFKRWYSANMFDGLDQDHDGRLSKSEFILNENAP